MKHLTSQCLVSPVFSPPLTPTSPGTPTPPMTPVSPGAPAGAAKHTCNHLHTIGGAGGNKNICTRCSQKKWPLMRRPSARKSEHRRSHHGEVTVLAVGRWAGVCECMSEAGTKRRVNFCFITILRPSEASISRVKLKPLTSEEN